MGLLDDTPAAVADRGGEGDKFIRLFFEVMDEADRAKFRRWIEDGIGTTEAHRRLVRHEPYRIGRSSVERGVHRLKAVGWVR